jgi:hypothetical protein
MNADTKAIASLLKITLEQALTIQDYINDNWLLDWSECSERKFNKVARQVWAKLSNA